MIALLVILVLVAVMIVPYVATTVARNVVRNMDRSPASGSIDQSLVEARLGRIEEAIDAMALQIERLADQKHVLLDRPGESGAGESESGSVERPR